MRLPVKREPKPREQVMVYLNGSSKAFRCSCGANVFTKTNKVYTCNGCRKTYQKGT